MVDCHCGDQFCSFKNLLLVNLQEWSKSEFKDNKPSEYNQENGGADQCLTGECSMGGCGLFGIGIGFILDLEALAPDYLSGRSLVLQRAEVQREPLLGTKQAV